MKSTDPMAIAWPVGTLMYAERSIVLCVDTPLAVAAGITTLSVR